MLIKIGFEIEFELPGPTPMILMLYVHPSRQADLRTEEKIHVEPGISLHDFIDLYGNRGARLLAPAGDLRLSLEAMIEDDGAPDAVCPAAMQHPVQDLPDETLPYPAAWTMKHLRPASVPGGEDDPNNPFMYRYTLIMEESLYCGSGI